MSDILNSILWFVVGLLMGMAATTQRHTNIHNTNGKTYVYLDVDKIISRITTEVANTEGSGAELQLKVSQMKERFETALTDYQRTHNAIIFSSPKSIKGADDKTDYFIEQVLKSNELRGGRK